MGTLSFSVCVKALVVGASSNSVLVGAFSICVKELVVGASWNSVLVGAGDNEI